MTEREAFLELLGKDEDDTTTRLVFADWLDDHGEHEEADRQRKWPAAKEWLVRFSDDNPHCPERSYAALIAFGHRVVKAADSADRVYLHDEILWDSLSAHSQEFWQNWSVVTGVPLPPSLDEKGFHTWTCCAHEVYYWFGEPDAEDPVVEQLHIWTDDRRQAVEAMIPEVEGKPVVNVGGFDGGVYVCRRIGGLHTDEDSFNGECEWADPDDARPGELTDGMSISCDCVRLGPGWWQDRYFGWYFVYDPPLVARSLAGDHSWVEPFLESARQPPGEA